jgi:hypothetical protein
MSGTLLASLANLLVHPFQIVFIATNDGQGNYFRDIV